MKTTFFSALLCAATLLLSCSKDKDNDSGFQWNKGKVFVGGYETDANGKYVAKLWIDGKEKSLSDGTKLAEVFDVAATATKVYAAGYEGDNGVLWTNGVATVLTAAGSTFGTATSVFVSGEDVYVVTTENTSEDDVTAKLWKNGVVEYVLSEDKVGTEANSIFVSGDDVYVAGMERNSNMTQAVLWKNGTPIFLTNTASQSGTAADVIVYGSDVYIVGREGDDAVLWKNNKEGKTVLGSGVSVYAESLAVINGEINVVGHNDTNGMLWVRSTTGAIVAQEISAFDYISSIATSDSKTYMTGVAPLGATESIARFSQNGETTDLTDGVREASANSIFVR